MWQYAQIGSVWTSSDYGNVWFNGGNPGGWRRLASPNQTVLLQQLAIVTAIYTSGRFANWYEVNVNGALEVQQIYGY